MCRDALAAESLLSSKQLNTKKAALAAVFKLGGATRCNYEDRLDFARPHLNVQMPHLMGFQPPGPELSKSRSSE